jgi:hypothetical protein
VFEVELVLNFGIDITEDTSQNVCLLNGLSLPTVGYNGLLNVLFLGSKL